MRIIKPNGFLRMFYPSLLWRMPKTAEKTLYLTFDDGPHPLITPLVLEILKRYNAKATFFCIGNNVQKYPDTFKQVKNAGHSVGCHTFNHEDGFKTKTDEYVESVLTANKLIHSNLFRPPHGRIRRSEIKKLQASNSKLQTVAWTVIAYDWDHALTPEDVYKNVITNADDGAIIAFHDSVKAYNNMVFALPKVLDYYYKQGYSFKAL